MAQLSPVERLLLAATKTDDCWLLTTNLDVYGYGRIVLNGAQHKAHRVTYENLVGPIPEGLVIDHLCRRRNCINPGHMEPITIGENVSRKPVQETCGRGHTGYFKIQSSGWRKCMECQREGTRRRYQERKNA